MKRARLLLVDDHAILREGLHRLLEADFEIVGHGANGQELIEKARSLRPDVVVTDISMPVMSGLEAVTKLHPLLPSTKFIFLTVHRDPAYIRRAFQSGASAYLPKRSAASELVTAIRTALSGRNYLSNADLNLVPDVSSLQNNSAETLTKRQIEILQLLAEGYSFKEMANSLGISIKTVEFHKSRLSQKLQLRTTAQLIRFAVENAVVTPST